MADRIAHLEAGFDASAGVGGDAGEVRRCSQRSGQGHRTGCATRGPRVGDGDNPEHPSAPRLTCARLQTPPLQFGLTSSTPALTHWRSALTTAPGISNTLVELTNSTASVVGLDEAPANPSIAFAHLEAPDLCVVLAVSRNTWREFQWPFNPPPEAPDLDGVSDLPPDRWEAASLPEGGS